MINTITDILNAVWFVLPAYIANATPVIAAKIIRNRHPIDLGKNFIDGKRILGDSKSWEGLLSGMVSGISISFVQYLIQPANLIVIRGTLLSIGALIGDLAGAFIKRRLGIKPGAPAPLIDQLSFLIVALLFVYLAGLYTLSTTQTIALIIITLLLHVISNAIAYLFGLKSVPW